MRLVSLSATNYRTLECLTIPFARDYCTISGCNNAGKSGVIRLLAALFRGPAVYPWPGYDVRLDYGEDKTQWLKDTPPITITYTLGLTKIEDPALISFVEKIATRQVAGAATTLALTYTLSESGPLAVAVHIDAEPTDEKAAKEIEKRIKDSNLLFLYNSTTPHEEFYFLGRGRRRMLYEFVMSEDEKRALTDAEKHVERRLKKLARAHTQGLTGILERLRDHYEVDFAPPESYATSKMPLGLNLKDRHVQVPLSDWGAGTQNRTHILMAILQANRIKTSDAPDERITPFVVIEEPESFLHPSAQAEFGRLLRLLSSELGIQIIATTHSPYMLNQDQPASNILLAREDKKRASPRTLLVDTTGDHWMAPFSEHLGLPAEEFGKWQALFSTAQSRVLLVEGPLDQEYFEYFQANAVCGESLSRDIEVAPYGGKDTLKNTLLVQFVLRKFDHVFVTYDLDADPEARAPLQRLGLREGTDFLAMGIAEPGKDAVEGLLPKRVLAAVQGRETDLVMKLGCRENNERRKAKDALKKMYLEEFKRHTDYTRDEVRELLRVVKAVNARLSAPVAQAKPRRAAGPAAPATPRPRRKTV